MKRLIPLLIPIVLLGITGCDSNKKQASTEYNNGVKHSARLQWDAAIASNTEAIRLNPDSAEAYYNRGLTYGKKGDEVQAQADLAKAKELGYEPKQ